LNEVPIIGVLSPVTGGFYYGRVLAGINRVVHAAGGRIVFVQTLDAGISSDEVTVATDFSQPIAWDHLDGAISIATGITREYLERLVARGVPVAIVSEVADGLDVPTAAPDNAGGVAAAVDHLIGHGHTRIGFAGNLVQNDMRERYAGYRAAMAAHGLEVCDDWVVTASDNGEVGGESVARQLLAAPLPVSALICATDRNAIGLLATLAEHGVCVPEDLAVVGFDGTETSAYTEPALTTVSQRFDEVGAAAARLVLDAVAGHPHGRERHVVAADLLVRQSCGCGNDRAALDPAAELAFWRAEAAEHFARSDRRERRMREQYEIGIRLLNHDLAAPQALGWLAGTDVRAAALAVWDGDPANGRLRIAGVYDRDGDRGDTIGEVVSVASFPAGPS